MTTGEIIFAVLVALQGLCVLVGIGLLIAFLKNYEKENSDKLIVTAVILWGISPIFSIIGVFFGFYF